MQKALIAMVALFVSNVWNTVSYAGGQSLYAKIVLDSFYCVTESSWDQGSTQDEVYFIFSRYAHHLNDPYVTIGDESGKIKIYEGVNSHDNVEFSSSGEQLVIFEGPVPLDTIIGFNAVLMEADGDGAEVRASLKTLAAEAIKDQAQGLKRKANAEKAKADFATVGITILAAAATSLAKDAIDGALDGIGAFSDDYIGAQTVLLTGEELLRWGLEHEGQRAQKPMTLEVMGGAEGKYRLRWHVELGKDYSAAFQATQGVGFSHWDSLVVDNFDHDSNDEILIVTDDDGPSSAGRFFFYDDRGAPVKQFFDAFYTRYDRVIAGDVHEGIDTEIVILSDDSEGQMRILNAEGEAVKGVIAVPFSKHDGAAVGDVLRNPEKDEIVIAGVDDKIRIFSSSGELLRTLSIPFDFRGTRYTGKTDRRDAFLVGDVVGTRYADIVLIHGSALGTGKKDAYIIDVNADKIDAFKVAYTADDAATLADILGDKKKELVVAADRGNREDGCETKIFDLRTFGEVDQRFWPCLTPFDGFTSGDVFGAGRDQVVLGRDEDDRVLITR